MELSQLLTKRFISNTKCQFKLGHWFLVPDHHARFHISYQLRISRMICPEYLRQVADLKSTTHVGALSSELHELKIRCKGQEDDIRELEADNLSQKEMFQAHLRQKDGLIRDISVEKKQLAQDVEVYKTRLQECEVQIDQVTRILIDIYTACQDVFLLSAWGCSRACISSIGILQL